MGSGDLEREIGELSGVLKSLAPSLEKMEERVNKAQTHAAAAQATYDAFRKEFDEWKTKVSYRLADIFQRIDLLKTGDLQSRNNLENLRNSVRDTIKREMNTYDLRLKGVESVIGRIKKREAGVLSKLWEIVKIVIAAVIGAAVSLLFK